MRANSLNPETSRVGATSCDEAVSLSGDVRVSEVLLCPGVPGCALECVDGVSCGCDEIKIYSICERTAQSPLLVLRVSACEHANNGPFLQAWQAILKSHDVERQLTSAIS